MRLSVFPQLHSCQNCWAHMSKRTKKTTSYSLYFPHRRGWDYEEPDVPIVERLKVGRQAIKEERKLWLKEWRDRLNMDHWREMHAEHNEVRMEWQLNSEEAINQWKVTLDADHKAGFSQAQLNLSPMKTAMFTGVIDTRTPKDGQIVRSGWVNASAPLKRKSFYRSDSFDWAKFNSLVMKIRGDGRTYLLNLPTPGSFDVSWHDVHNYPLFTHGGPYWQYVKIPFSKFYFSVHSRIQDKQVPMLLRDIRGFSITLCDKNAGPFQLEIAWVGVMFDCTHFEQFAYELYECDHPAL